MWGNKFDEEADSLDGLGHQQEQAQIKLQLNRRIHALMPANQLRTVRRPQNMQPRTFFLHRPFGMLPSSLIAATSEQSSPSEGGKLKVRLGNTNVFSLEQYFSNNTKFKCIYNRLQSYRVDCMSFTGKLKGIDGLIDYNWRNFKQLQPLSTHRTYDINDRIDADFQCGNLCKAYTRIQQSREYYLLIQNDINTYGYNQWFMYRVRNKGTGVRRFIIANMSKKTSFYQQGMLISIHSKQKLHKRGIGWYKGGQKVTFNITHFIREHHQGQYYYCLAFQYDFQWDHDQVYFALSQPYPYTRMVKTIQKINSMVEHVDVTVKNLCYSVSNNIIPLVKITQKGHNKDKAILFLARQHPCQTVGSFVAEGLLKHLTDSSNQLAQYLLSHFEFYVIPMVNPDGVIHGMSRCNMSGLDLNRQWGQGLIKQLTPQTAKIKQFISTLSKTKLIKYAVDLHGHGKKLDSFFFCCRGGQKENYKKMAVSMSKLQSRFNLSQCTFGIGREKQNTIRSRIHQMGVAHSYTLQTSLYGWKNTQGQIRHFNQDDYNAIAQSLLASITLIEGDSKTTMELVGMTTQSLQADMQLVEKRMNGQEKNEIDQRDILSDSDPQGDKLDMSQLLRDCHNKTIRKKLETNTEKKPKMKKVVSKKQCQHSGGHKNRLSCGNMRECSQKTQSQTKINPSNLISTGQLIKKDQRPTSKKISFSEKWKERRKEIAERRRQQQQEKRQAKEAKEQKKRLMSPDPYSQTRSRVKSEFIQNATKQIPLPSKLTPSHPRNNIAKKKLYAQKIKTQIQEVHDISNLTQQEIKDTDIRKSALELRFKQLKQESLNNILTDTLSILKIGGGSHPRQRAVSKVQEPKQASIAAKRLLNSSTKKVHLTTEPSMPAHRKTSLRKMKGSESGKEPEQSIRYKKFKQFIQNTNSGNGGGGWPHRGDGSVFYYFPVL